MPNFIFAYHGGNMPEDKDEMTRIMEAWGAWMQSIGPSFVDQGAPLGNSHTIAPSGVTANGGANPLSGYSIVQAENIEAAIELSKGCPGLGNGGTVEVAQCMNM